MSRGLVLEGGGLRGIFSAGVLDYFMEQGLSFDTLIGVSAGSINGCSYQSHQPGRAKRVSTEYLGDSRYCSVKSWLTTGDMFGVDFCYRQIPELLDPMDYKAFAKNPCRFFTVVTDLESGQAVYKEIDDIYHQMEWIRASASLPVLSKTVKLDGGLYLDGGIADSIPYRQSVALGNEKNVVVLTQPKGFVKKPSSAKNIIALKYRKYPEFVWCSATRHLRYNDTLELLAQDEAAGKVFVIQPEAALDISRTEKDKGKVLAGYDAGYERAKELYPALMEYLNR